MKVKLSVGKEPFGGYLNIDPSPKLDQEYLDQYKIINQNPLLLNQLVENSECEELILDEVISFIRSEDLFDFIQLCCKKVRHRGFIIITDIDTYKVTRAYNNGEITTPQLNELFFGAGKDIWKFKSGSCNMEEICDMLIECGILIQQKYFDGFKFIVRGYRE